MQRLGPLTTFSIAESVGAIILWLAAFPTRGWLTGNLLLVDVSVGLFTLESKGVVQDLTISENPLLTTIVLEVLGGFFAVVALGNLAVAVLKSNRTFVTVFMFTAFLSGIFSLAGTFYFNVNADMQTSFALLSVGYSWYLALFSSILEFSSVVALGSAARRGEISFGASNVVRMY